jgi:hypothetical protein
MAPILGGTRINHDNKIAIAGIQGGEGGRQ